MTMHPKLEIAALEAEIEWLRAELAAWTDGCTCPCCVGAQMEARRILAGKP